MRQIIRRAHRDERGANAPGDPDDLWIRCPRCKELQYRPKHEEALGVCSKCKYHFRMTADARISVTVDDGSFRERDKTMPPVDPLHFSAGSRSYLEKLEHSQEATGRAEAFIYGSAALDANPLIIGAIEMDFIAGSMGATVGEKVTRSMELALDQSLPLVLFSSSGGARMQEGAVALMQLAKVLTRIDDLSAAGLPYISVMTDPCYGGVTASFAMLGDVNIAEPGAYIGFAGPRVIEQTTREKLPPGAATAEFLLKHGMIDLVVPRIDMKATLSRLLRIYSASDLARTRPRFIENAGRSTKREELRVGV